MLNITVYTARLETTVTAADGVALAAAVSWSFTTVNAAPTVLSTTPLNNATAVARETTPPNSSHSTIPYAALCMTTFTLTPAGGSPVAASVSHAASTATFSPLSLHDALPIYTARLETTVTAADGVALAAAVSWSFTTVNAAPTVLSTTPLNNATAVARETTPPNSSHSTIPYAALCMTTFTLTPAGGSPVAASVSHAASTATFSPLSLHDALPIYTARLETTVTAADGVALAAAVSWSFTTVNAAPTVLATTPLNNATAVSLGASATATFSRRLVAYSLARPSLPVIVGGGLRVAATVSYAVSQAALAAPRPFPTRRSSDLRLETTVTAADGVALAAAVSWSFTTVNAAPTVLATTPLNNATAVSLGASATATFSR